MKTHLKKRKMILLSAVLCLLFSMGVRAEEEPRLNGFTYDEYRDNVEKQSALVKTKRVNMTFKENSVSCDVFMYYGQLFIPVRTAAELMDKSIIYDDETGSARITDIYPNGQAEGVIFEGGEVRADFNQMPVYYKDDVFAYSDVWYDTWRRPDGFNCNGYIYAPMAELTEAFGYYRYCDEEGNIFIEESSGRIKETDNEAYEEYMESRPGPNPVRPYVDEELLKEAEHSAWSMYAKVEGAVGKCETTTFTFQGKDYIEVGVERMDEEGRKFYNGSRWIAVIVYEVL